MAVVVVVLMPMLLQLPNGSSEMLFLKEMG
jgi:hypothetical protein